MEPGKLENLLHRHRQALERARRHAEGARLAGAVRKERAREAQLRGQRLLTQAKERIDRVNAALSDTDGSDPSAPNEPAPEGTRPGR